MRYQLFQHSPGLFFGICFLSTTRKIMHYRLHSKKGCMLLCGVGCRLKRIEEFLGVMVLSAIPGDPGFLVVLVGFLCLGRVLFSQGFPALLCSS